MKWKEFKDAVEAKGVKDEEEIIYIDVSCKSHIKEVDTSQYSGEWIIEAM